MPILFLSYLHVLHHGQLRHRASGSGGSSQRSGDSQRGCLRGVGDAWLKPESKADKTVEEWPYSFFWGGNDDHIVIYIYIKGKSSIFRQTPTWDNWTEQSVSGALMRFYHDSMVVNSYSILLQDAAIHFVLSLYWYIKLHQIDQIVFHQVEGSLITSGTIPSLWVLWMWAISRPISRISQISQIQPLQLDPQAVRCWTE